MKDNIRFYILPFIGMAFSLAACLAQDRPDRPWYENTYRWAQTNFTEDDPVKADLDFLRERWKANHIQGVIINCGGIVAYYPSKFGLQYRAKFLGDRDFFKDVADAAAEQGIKVVARMDINRTTKEFFDAHPDWFARNKRNEPIMAGDRYMTCVNSDYYKKYIPEVLTEIIERYHPVGFTDNSWKGTDPGTICYCENCKKRFKTDCGKELPERVDWEDPVYREWVRWGYACRLENWDLFNATTQRVGGKDCLWFGMVHGDPRGGMFVDLKGVLSRSKMVFCDHQGREGMGFEQNAVNGTLLRFAANEHVIVPESMANYVRGNAFFRLSANPKEETRLWMIEGIAGGLSPWFHHVNGGQYDRRQFETPVPVFDWHAKNERYLYIRTDIANVGLVWNQANTDFYGRGDAGNRVMAPWKGFCMSLSKHAIPFLAINAQDIAKYSPRLKTLILPHIAVLSDEEIDAVCDFLDRGGNLVISGVTATRDFDGEPSANDKLWRCIGLKLSNETRGGNGHNYIRLPQGERHEIFAGFEETDILPFGGTVRKVESTGTLKPLGSFIPDFTAYPPEFSWIREEDPNAPPVWAGTLASGCRVVYLAGDFDRCAGQSGLPDQARLLANVVRWAANGSIPLVIDGQGQLDCKIYRQENRLIVHLVNVTGTDRRGYLDSYLAAGPFHVTIDAQGLAPKQAMRTVTGGSAPMKLENGKIHIAIDRILDHEMLVIE
ncbi:MAG: beta-galactosidase [Planctomycetaceae bacterium]|nr:beta-galactosidase [Planctomycetaceae bacterium]